jgi:2,3-bisphosphoglycerate-dependent phosphoglycerate mutase
VTKTVTVARHGESDLSARGIVNGDPAVPCALSPVGRNQARALGQCLVGEPVTLAVTSTFRRTAETAEIALAGRGVRRLALPALDDLRFGEFEGRPITEYRAWSASHDVGARVPGGESRLDAIGRYCRALRNVLALPDAEHLLVVAHGLPLAYLVQAASGGQLTGQVEPLEPGVPHRLARGDVRAAIGRLERWSEGRVA